MIDVFAPRLLRRHGMLPVIADDLTARQRASRPLLTPKSRIFQRPSWAKNTLCG
jgi:hypothetical protein